MPSKKAAAKNAEQFPCGFCSKVFQREGSLHVHMCVGKQRNAAKNEQPVRMAFRIWLRFYQLTTRNSKKTWDDFIRSRYYNDFLKVGKYVVEINPVRTPEFIDFLINSGLPVMKWTNKAVYETYIRELSKKETPGVAVERSITIMEQWAGASGEQWFDFFRKVGPAQATMWITTGRLSPWVLYISKGSIELFNRMSPEQLGLIQNTIDPAFWTIKLDKHKEDVSYLRELLDEAGV